MGVDVPLITTGDRFVMGADDILGELGHGGNLEPQRRSASSTLSRG